MARVIINTSDLLERIEKMRTDMQKFQELDPELLKKRPAEKKWSVMEVIEHMNLGHKPYKEKIEDTFPKLPESTSMVDNVKAGGMASYLMKRFPPAAEGKIRFKMKTFGPFHPVLELDKLNGEKSSEIFKSFYDSLDHLKSAIERFQKKEVKAKKFNSAVGAWVRFNIAEAIQFVICHNERHMQQIRNTLVKLEE